MMDASSYNTPKVVLPNPDTMLQQIKDLAPGQRMIYHTGFLHEDRQFDVPVARRAAIAWDAYEMGIAFLFQKRLNQHNCDYIIVRRRAK